MTARERPSHRGVYGAERASALSGVPVSTLRYWAKHDILVPAVSDERPALWSYDDLIGLRQKTLEDGAEIPASTMPTVKQALHELRHLGWDARGQLPGPWVDLLLPFETVPGVQAPDLRRPRPTLRIEPAKLTGAPHVAGTRVETEAIFALRSRGLDEAEILKLYPFLEPSAIHDAVQFEQQLAANLKAA